MRPLSVLFCGLSGRRRKPLNVELTDVEVLEMKAALDKLVESEKGSGSRKAEFCEEMQAFLRLFASYIKRKRARKVLVWDRVQPVAEDQIVSYNSLPATGNPKNLRKLAVLKVNGGLGTSMGMPGAKSALEVKSDMTFLDLTVRQIASLNAAEHADVPLLLMTSFHTHDDTARVVRKYADDRVHITTFSQSRYPRVYKENMMPCPKNVRDDHDCWYPPGHGDLYYALAHSGVLDKLLGQGKQYLFVSNSDNLGATVDERILEHMVSTQADFLMEVTDKTRADVQGGTLVNYDGHIRLLEMAQVPPDHEDDFQSARNFKLFNTNNLWINLQSLKHVMDKGGMDLDLIVREKNTDDGQTVVQLETPAGSAIKHFDNAHGVHVPRTRFIPVKTCSDLLLLKSDIYVLQNDRLVPNPDRMFTTTPVVKLGDHYRKIQEFQERFRQIPKIAELDHLTVTGDVHWGRNITLRGTVIVAASEGQRIDIPSGTVLENKLISGNLNLIEL